MMAWETQVDIETKVRQDCYNRGYEQGRKNPCEEIVECIEKLQKQVKEYQDKIDQGTLIELPCNVGEKACRFYRRDNGEIWILEGTVIKIEMNRKGILIHFNTLPNFYLDKCFIGDLQNRYIDLEAYYFCHKEAAEERLKELQEGKK